MKAIVLAAQGAQTSSNRVSPVSGLVKLEARIRKVAEFKMTGGQRP